jgi:hypothetical protein
MASTAVIRSPPMPPYFSGIAIPSRPRSPILRQMPSGRSSCSSICSANGTTSFSQKRLTVSMI